VAGLCCAPPAVAFALGLGGSAFLVGLAQYQPYFVIAGLAVVLAFSRRSLRIAGHCAPRERWTRLYRLGLTLVAFAGGYWTISYLLLPWLYTIG
jgi:hypothetical protein